MHFSLKHWLPRAALGMLAGASLSAQSLTSFPMIGITRGQILQINVVAFPPVPCLAQLGFQDSHGNLIGTTTTASIAPGQAASIAIKGNALANVAGQWVEVLPTVVVNPNSPPNACAASAEVFDGVLGVTSVLVPGSPGFSGNPEFGWLGLTVLQTARLNVVAFPPVPCIGQISFVNTNGVLVGNAMNVQLSPGQAAFLDLPGNALVTQLGARAEVRPVLVAPEGGCAASVEVYVNGLGTTTALYPPDPCNAASTSCIVFP